MLFCNNTAFSQELIISNSWVREAPPNARNLAGYAELKNATDKPIIISKITSSAFERVEMHVTRFENGMMHMMEVKELIIKPDETVAFEPGGKHFMLIKPHTPIKAGQKIPLTMELKSGKKFEASLMVKK